MRDDMTSHFLIVICDNCGKLLLARVEQKARTCPYCSFKVALEKAKKVASAENAQQASTILRKLKGLGVHDSFKANH
ncbi:MAG: DUF1922 domain-containing protein [Candidatus Bathyarchaeia archaeon]